MTFIDARSVDPLASVRCDVCIVGAGAAGITLARELVRTSLEVVLLESGGTTPEAATTALYDMEVEGLPISPVGRERYFGGTTNSWWGKLAFFDAIDLRKRPWVPFSGWPIGPDELEPYYARAAHVVGAPELATREWQSLGPSRGPTLANQELRPTCVFSRRPPIRFADIHRAEVAPAPNVRTFLRANLIGLDFSDAGTIQRLRVSPLGGEAFTVEPRATVLSCGGIENARLLLALCGPSARRPRNACLDAVGRYYMDHPKGVCGRIVVAPNSGRVLDRSYWTGRSMGSVRLERGVALTESAQQRHEVLNSYVMLQPEYEGKDSPGVAALRSLYSRGFRATTSNQLRLILTDVPKMAGAARFKLLNHGGLRAVALQNFLEQSPEPSNRVRLLEATDALGMPKASVTWEISELDQRTMAVLHQAIDREVRHRGIGYVESPLLSGDAQWTIVQDASHHMGTTRMGGDRATSVVDKNCRVHSVDNLFVAGSSVFPTSGYANPTLAIVALAIRLADHLRRSYSRK